MNWWVFFLVLWGIALGFGLGLAASNWAWRRSIGTQMIEWLTKGYIVPGPKFDEFEREYPAAK